MTEMQQPGPPPKELMVGALGQPLTHTRAWCNLCIAEGREFGVDAHDPSWMKTMEQHTRLKHPEHQAALEAGEKYEPVEIEEPRTWM
jgi:hypothetical protein